MSAGRLEELKALKYEGSRVKTKLEPHQLGKVKKLLIGKKIWTIKLKYR